MALRDDILARLDIVDLVGKYVQLKKTGKNRSGLCPFHKEKTPSFTVAEDKQIFKCFGCGKGGNAITFHMEIERLDFRDSVQYLAKELHIDIAQYQNDPEQSKQQSSEREKNKLINRRLQSLFQQSFPGSIAESYVKDARKLQDETIKQFGLGYAPDSHYDVVSLLKSKGFTPADLTKAGVAKTGSSGDTYAFFKNRLTFPIYDHMGTIVGFGARALDSNDTGPKYLNTTETPLYDKSKILYGMNIAKSNIRDFGALIIVEGYMDVIALSQYGLPVGIATCGTALTQEHIKLIKRQSDTLIFAFDNDKAGFDATIRGLKVAYAQDLFPRVLGLPSGSKDIDEFLTKKGGSTTMDELTALTDEGFSFVLNRLGKELSISNPVERLKLQAIAFDILESIEDYGIFMIYMENLAAFLNTSSQVLVTQYKAHIKKQKRPQYQQKDSGSKKDNQSDQEALIGALLFENFLSNNHFNDEKITHQVSILKTISSHMPDNHLIKTLLSDQGFTGDNQGILESQLWRENQREGLSHDKAVALITRLLQQYNHQAIRMLLKSSSLTHEDKQLLMQLSRKK